MLRPNDIEGLNLALKASVEERAKREKFWRRFRNELVGPRWRESVGTKRVTNQVALYVETMRDVLAFQSGTVNLKARIPGVGGPIAEVYELALEHNMNEIKWLEQLRLMVVDSFYAVGIAKTGLMPSSASADPGFVMGDDGYLDPLMPFTVRVSPFDFLWDDTGRHWRESSYFGQEFDRDLELILNDPRYDLRFVENPQEIPTSHTDMDKHERTGERWREEFNKKTPKKARLVEMWLRDANMMVTLLRMGQDKWIPIRMHEFWGGEDGPYHLLGYTWVPDSVMPLAPGQSWWEQWHELEQQEFDLMTQVKNEKTIVAFPSGAGESAKIADEAKTHSFVTGVDNLGDQRTYGGATAQKLTAVTDARARFEQASGLSDILRGVQSRTDETATAVSIRDRHTNVRLDAMQNAILDFSEETLKDMLWYMWYDPAVVQQVGVPVDEGRQQAVQVTLQGGTFVDPMTGLPDLSMDLPDFYLKIVRDSFMRRSGPLERLQALEEANLVLGPLAMVAASQGFMMDLPAYLKDLGDRIGNDMLERLFIPMTPLAAQLQMMGQQAGMMGVLGAQSTGTIEADAPTSPQGQAASGAGAVSAPLGVANRPPGGATSRRPKGEAK